MADFHLKTYTVTFWVNNTAGSRLAKLNQISTRSVLPATIAKDSQRLDGKK